MKSKLKIKLSLRFNTPILFLCFNRPEETKKSFSIIEKIKPTKLYIAQDGPRDEEEKEKTIKVHKIVKDISWPCEIHYLIRDENLGVKRAVNDAIDWFFEAEEMGIVIEDDILPDESFFSFAAQLLEKYKNDTRIMLISGCNLLDTHSGYGDYFFTKIGAIWGWASWRRVWRIHDKEMKRWNKIENDPVAMQILPRAYWNDRVKKLNNSLEGTIDTWDYQFTMTRLVNSGLSIIPRWNLIENIGFNEGASHTKNKPSFFKNSKSSISTKNLIHPIVIAPDNEFDLEIYNKSNLNHNISKKESVKQKLRTFAKFLPQWVKNDIKKRFVKNKRANENPEWIVIESGKLQGIKLFINSKQPNFNEMALGKYDDYLWEFLDDCSLRGSIAIDIGAHIGYHSLAILRQYNNISSVIAFEPNVFNVQRMQLIITENPEYQSKIEIREKALSNKTGSSKFRLSSNIDNQTSSGGYLSGITPPLGEKTYKNANFFETEVEVSTLDKELVDYKNISLIKIDVEGAEHLVLEGAKKLIHIARPIFLIEIHSVECMYRVLEILNKYNYDIHMLKVDRVSRCFIGAKPSVI